VSDKARAMALSIMNVAGQGQTDIGPNQRPRVVDVEAGASPYEKVNPLTTTPQKCQR